ncbi:MAG: UDP-N-acetylmuramate--L-alanine ligase [Deltaproteobacteria bacterium]|nr:UDP-N-acetylmuramate--L-alanine ligase [Deltaproteobacteria bacterium]
MFSGRIQHVHFIGIGGSGMCGIAEVLATQGYQVTGSDQRESPVLDRLRRLGATVEIGHRPENVHGAQVVVRSTAVPDSNPEVREALARKVPVIPRAEMLGELMRTRYGLAVAGTHGKTTTTSMLARCMHHAGLDPTIVIGGKLDALGSSARLGAGEFLVAEADESDGSFLTLSPTVAVVTNIDPEHMEHWRTIEALTQGFVDFANKVPFFGFSVLCLDHPRVQALMPRVRRRVLTYGFSAQADLRAEGVEHEGTSTRFTVLQRGARLGVVQLGMPGRHNVQNALAAMSVALELGVAFDTLQEALHGFSGVDRRFSLRATRSLAAGGAPVQFIDDYGHHPTEIAATLAGARLAWPSRRIVAVFQPHRFTRVRDLLDEFATCFHEAGHVVVCPVYRAGEAPIPGIDEQAIAERIGAFGHRSVAAVADLGAATEHLLGAMLPGDVVITLGAGDVNKLCQTIPEALDAHA